MDTEKELRKKARKKAENIVGFYTHLAVYIMVNLLLIVIWFVNDGFNTFPWFIFPLFGWGIGLVAHGITTYTETQLADKIEEREYQKMKNKGP